MLQDVISNNHLLTSAVSLWFLGVISILMRKIPSRLYSFIKSFFIITLTVNKGSPANAAIMDFVIAWFMSTKYSKRSKKFLLESTIENRHLERSSYSRQAAFNSGFLLTPGMGFNFFIYNKTFGWITRQTGKDSSSTTSSSEIIVNFVTTKNCIIDSFLKDITFKDSTNTVEIYSKSEGHRSDWSLSRDKFKRNISSVVIEKEVKNKIINEITDFFDSKLWYETKGINHKLTYLFHGLPGTGKSSLIFALACHFNKKVYLLNMSDIASSAFQKLLLEVPKDAFIVLEDFQIVNTEIISEKEEGKQESKSGLTLSVVLNILDGVNSVSGNLIFLTTNHLNKLPTELLRKGRIDHIVEIVPLQDTEVKEYIKHMFPEDKIDDSLKFKEITGCDIQALFLYNRDNYVKFIESLEKE